MNATSFDFSLELLKHSMDSQNWIVMYALDWKDKNRLVELFGDRS